MPKRANLDCQRCAAQSVEIAQAKSCWNGQPCHSKRSYYAKHSVNKAKKLGRHRSNRAHQLIKLDIPLYNHKLLPEVLMTFYRNRADGPIHALEFAVIDHGKAIASVNPIHLTGVPQSQLRTHIKNVIGLLSVQFGRQQLPNQQELPLASGLPPDDTAPALSVKKDRQPANMCPLCLKKRLEKGPEHD